jgi:hypothetical protein
MVKRNSEYLQLVKATARNYRPELFQENAKGMSSKANRLSNEERVRIYKFVGYILKAMIREGYIILLPCGELTNRMKQVATISSGMGHSVQEVVSDVLQCAPFIELKKGAQQ